MNMAVCDPSHAASDASPDLGRNLGKFMRSYGIAIRTGDLQWRPEHVSAGIFSSRFVLVCASDGRDIVFDRRTPMLRATLWELAHLISHMIQWSGHDGPDGRTYWSNALVDLSAAPANIVKSLLHYELEAQMLTLRILAKLGTRQWFAHNFETLKETAAFDMKSVFLALSKQAASMPALVQALTHLSRSTPDKILQAALPDHPDLVPRSELCIPILRPRLTTAD